MRPIASILLVDDDTPTLKILVDLFQSLKVPRICALATADEALEAVKKETFTIIIADYHLKEESGVEFLEELRRHGDQTPILMMSGLPDTDAVLRTCNLTRTQFIGKPFRLTELLSTVDKLVEA